MGDTIVIMAAVLMGHGPRTVRSRQIVFVSVVLCGAALRPSCVLLVTGENKKKKKVWVARFAF